jgi:hypothetical protein
VPSFPLTIQNCPFSSNEVFDSFPWQGTGGAIYIAGGTVCISKNTGFSDNIASIDPDIFGPFTLC